MKRYENVKPQIIKEGELIHRSFVCDQVKAIDAEKRQIDFVISTERADRMGDVITINGWDLKEYRKNPVVLFGHASRVPPIGKAIKVWKDPEALRATAEFMSEDISPFAHSIFRMYQEGFLKAVSVGFVPQKWERMTDDEDNFTGYKFLKQELLEFSAVPIPANPDALLDAKAKGIDVHPFKDFCEELLDNWKDNADPVLLLYGVDKKGVEMIRRKAASTKSTLKISPDVQDDLLARNLAAAKAQKAAAAVDGEGTGGHENEAVTTEKTLVEKLLEFGEAKFKEIGESGLATLSTECDGITIHTEKDDDGVTVTLEDTPQKAMITLDVFKDNADTLFKHFVSVEEKDGDFLVSIKGENKSVVYRALAVLKDTETVLLDLVSEKLAEAEEKKTEKAEEADTTEKQDEKSEDAGDAEATNDKGADEADKSADETSTDESGEEEKADETADENEKDLEGTMKALETVLCDVEELLDKSNSSGNEKGLSKREQRKLEFLAGWMRELAERIQPAKSADDEKSAETEGHYVEAEDLKKALNEKVAPMVEQMVRKAISKFRGRLD